VHADEIAQGCAKSAERGPRWCNEDDAPTGVGLLFLVAMRPRGHKLGEAWRDPLVDRFGAIQTSALSRSIPSTEITTDGGFSLFPFATEVDHEGS
jgi:hypothetical protein